MKLISIYSLFASVSICVSIYVPKFVSPLVMKAKKKMVVMVVMMVMMVMMVMILMMMLLVVVMLVTACYDD